MGLNLPTGMLGSGWLRRCPYDFLAADLRGWTRKQDTVNKAVGKMMETHECMGVPKSFPNDIWSKRWMS